MKKLILMSVVFLMSSCNLGIYTQEMRTIIPKREVTKSECELFTEALIQVESEGNPKASQSYRMKIMKQMKIINQKYCGERKKSVFQHRRFC